jgi:hypothetical protein
VRAGRGGGGLFNDENEDCQGVARVRKQKLNLCFLFFSFFNLTVSYHIYARVQYRIIKILCLHFTTLPRVH